MKFCSDCAHPVSLQIPPDDTRARYVCQQCGIIHYQNPKMVVGSIPLWDEGEQPQVLLCRRAIEPRHGYWTLPAGFMENSETTAEAAARETMEEAGARIEMQSLFTLINVAHVHQVHLFYRARLLDLDFAAGIESLCWLQGCGGIRQRGSHSGFEKGRGIPGLPGRISAKFQSGKTPAGRMLSLRAGG